MFTTILSTRDLQFLRTMINELINKKVLDIILDMNLYKN